jgi:hypothetical protein
MLNTGEPVSCPACGKAVLAAVFPAQFRPLSVGKAGETILIEGEAGCFYHADKKAVVPCADCGRFLCALCDVELNGRHLCPNCLETGRLKGRLTEIEHRRVLYDSAALTMSLVPLLVWPVTLVTAPIAMFLAVQSWRKPGSLLPRTRIRAYLAILIGLLQMGGWGFLVWNIIESA